MFLTTAVTVVGVWLALGLRSGLWAPNFLLSIFVLTFQFAIFYAVSTLVAVLTRSPIVCILVACFTWVILWAVGTGHIVLDAMRDIHKDVQRIPEWVYSRSIRPLRPAALQGPRRAEHRDDRPGSAGSRQPRAQGHERIYTYISWGKSLGFTVGFIALMLASRPGPSPGKTTDLRLVAGGDKGQWTTDP